MSMPTVTAAPIPATRTYNTSEQALLCFSQQASVWHRRARTELINTSRSNMLHRLSEITNMVNKHHASLQGFHIAAETAKRMFDDVDNAITAWQGVDIASCKQYKASFKEYKVTATNWFNRNKSKIYGNYFFYPLLFHHILNHCKHIENKHMDEDAKMTLFIDLLLLIADGKVTFLRSRAQPMLPYQVLFQPNEFKTACKELLAFYREDWKSNTISPCKIHRKYQKDKNRSNKIFSSFVECLKLVQCKLKSRGSLKYGFFTLPRSVFPDYHATDCDISAQRNQPPLAAIKNEPNYSDAKTEEMQMGNQLISNENAPNTTNARNNDCRERSYIRRNILQHVNVGNVSQSVNTTATANRNSRCRRMLPVGGDAMHARQSGNIRHAPIAQPSFVENHNLRYHQMQSPSVQNIQCAQVRASNDSLRSVVGNNNRERVNNVNIAANANGVNAINVRYQLLWLHPNIDPIVISTTLV